MRTIYVGEANLFGIQQVDDYVVSSVPHKDRWLFCSNQSENLVGVCLQILELGELGAITLLPYSHELNLIRGSTNDFITLLHH